MNDSDRRRFLIGSLGLLGGMAMSRAHAQMLKPVITAAQARPWHLRDVVVCIDPGHGGRDPGAIGPHGTYEKNVVLDIGLRLKRLIEAEPGMRPVMARDSDRYVTLEERVYFAQRHRADLFLAIHADAFPSPQPHGSSVYVFTRHGASSESAAVLAESQNRLDRAVGLKDRPDSLLSRTLFDLESHAVIDESLIFGKYVMDSITHVDPYRYTSVQRAPFVVLASPAFPSLLVETAFISNPEQERQLRNPVFRERMAQALLKGIKGYFRHHAPPGTLLAARSNALQALSGQA